ncbi:MAG TPA: hypothetical protein VGC66_12800 [Pyrinomonadaceae bacterium]|jgi:hypothetical protein
MKLSPIGTAEHLLSVVPTGLYSFSPLLIPSAEALDYYQSSLTGLFKRMLATFLYHLCIFYGE